MDDATLKATLKRIITQQDRWGVHTIGELMEKLDEQFDAIESLRAERDALAAVVYVPGLWKCEKCNFRLLQSNLNMGDGSITARNDPGDKCPNCNGPLWRVSERDDRKEAEKLVDRYFDESQKLAAQLAAACETLKPFAGIAELVAREHPGWDHDEFKFIAGNGWLWSQIPFKPFRQAARTLSSLEEGRNKPLGFDDAEQGMKP